MQTRFSFGRWLCCEPPGCCVSKFRFRHSGRVESRHPAESSWTRPISASIPAPKTFSGRGVPSALVPKLRAGADPPPNGLVPIPSDHAKPKRPASIHIAAPETLSRPPPAAQAELHPPAGSKAAWLHPQPRPRHPAVK